MISMTSYANAVNFGSLMSDDLSSPWFCLTSGWIVRRMILFRQEMNKLVYTFFFIRTMFFRLNLGKGSYKKKKEWF